MKKLILFGFLAVFTSYSQTIPPKEAVVNLVRPANATTYAVGDVVCGTDSLPSLFVSFSSFQKPAGVILGARIGVDTANAASGTFTLFLYKDSTGLGKIADNAAHANSISRDSLLIGTINFTLETTGSASGTSAYDLVLDHPLYFSLSNVSSSTTRGVWGRLTATGAWVPKVSGRIRLALTYNTY